MAIYNDFGIIFKVRDFGEADKVVSVLGKNKGRVDAIAKGARRPTSRKTASIDLMNYGKFSFAEGKNLDILTEVRLEDSFEKTKNNLETSKYLFYVAELIDTFFPEATQGEEIFDLLRDLLQIISKSNQKLLTVIFELKVLDISGFGPNTYTCTLCGDDLKAGTDRVAHSGSEIGFICAEHMNKGVSDLSSVSDKVVKVMRFLIEEDLRTALNLKEGSVDLDYIIKLNRLWIQSIIGKPIKSYKFLSSN